MKSRAKKVAIVTGGARGIGRAIAETLSKDGDSVVIVDISDEGKKTADSIGGYFVRADLSRPEECRMIVEKTVAKFGTVDILVNNAGFQHVAPIRDFPPDVWDKMSAVMLRAPYLLTKYSWDYMASKKWGRVVNIASIHGLIASPSKSGYVAVKHGLIGLTKVTALEGGPLGITANAICPTYVQTDLVENQVGDLAKQRKIPKEEVVQKVLLEHAAIKRLIQPSEVADLVSYICSDKASAITGSSLTIDLGWLAS